MFLSAYMICLIILYLDYLRTSLSSAVRQGILYLSRLPCLLGLALSTGLEQHIHVSQCTYLHVYHQLGMDVH